MSLGSVAERFLFFFFFFFNTPSPTSVIPVPLHSLSPQWSLEIDTCWRLHSSSYEIQYGTRVENTR